MIYKRTTKSLAEIGRELGVDYLLESSLRAEGDMLRVTSKLIRTRDQVPEIEVSQRKFARRRSRISAQMTSRASNFLGRPCCHSTSGHVRLLPLASFGTLDPV